MKEKIIIILALLIVLSGCINNNSKTIKNPSKNDIQLTISIENNTIHVNSTFINITVQLINTRENQIYIYSEYDIMMDFEIINPYNITFAKVDIDDYIGNRIVLDGHEKKEYSFNLKERVFRSTNDEIRWNINGTYRIRCIYHDIEDTFYSNFIEFHIFK